MSDSSWFARQRDALANLQRLVRERAEAERTIAARHAEALESAERDHARAQRQQAASRKKAEDELAAKRSVDERSLRQEFDGELAAAESRFATAKLKADAQHKQAEDVLKLEYKDRLWTIDSLLEAGEKEASDAKADLDRKARTAAERLAECWSEAEKALRVVNLGRDDVRFAPERLPAFYTTDPEGKVEKSIEDVEHSLGKLGRVLLPKLTGVIGTTWCVFVAGGLTAAVILLSFRIELWKAIGIGLLGAVGGGLLLRQILYWLARRQIRDRGTAFGVFAAEGERSVDHLKKHAQGQLIKALAAVRQTHTDAKKECDESFRPRIANIVKQGVTLAAKLEREAAETKQNLISSRNAAQAEIASSCESRSAEIAATQATDAAKAAEAFASKREAAEAERDRTWSAAVSSWHEGMEAVRSTCDDLVRAGQHFPEWAELKAAPTATDVPEGIRFGSYAIDQSQLPDGDSTHPDFASEPLRVELPAYLPFPDRSAVLLKAKDAGRPATVAAMQAMMLRFLTGLPPGKVRFTIIDPVGLGENFAAFMHLADTDPLLVSDRIWTEPGQIEAKLADLTEHMENVIQKYLRNQYASIEDYNRAAGEVAEPYRVLAIANFPTNFSPSAAKRLVSIMSSGPACGVCTLVGVDASAALPRDFRLADLEQVAFALNYREGAFHTKDPAFDPFPLSLEAPPPPSELADAVKRVGDASRFAARVEVPFDFIAPPPDQLWKGSTKHGFEVPIGRAGATRRRIFSLGRGTAQHALIAGKTGSGKSTLLHALITNLALHYSPDEAELYLIDFKEGVEFKMYAARQLPHARVVAIESEREFGLSVLQRLDAILRERGDEFRRAGVNDVSGFREAKPQARLPRILLVIDEFQMLFVEDDKLGQEAAQILDRLVRQGRAFGVHVLLGSQTLGGAYSLPRSTIDQMAVRIALQCSEADAQLILSKDNSAARLLTRPGEAIYNDANGTIEGNDPFQVVWLSEEQREAKLAMLHRMAGDGAPSPLVFEGSARAELGSNRVLAKLIETPNESAPPTIWLGDSVAIKDPTAAIFRPQSGANLLIVGQGEELALGIAAAGLVALSARLRQPGVARPVAAIDGTPDDSDFAESLRRTCKALPGLDFVERYRVGEVLAELAAEVDRRTKNESPDRSPRFLFVNGLHRLRELRKPDDDFGYRSREAKSATPGEHFATVLRDGPAVGIHSIVWSDSMTNLTRALDRSGLREFSMRVLFQMNPNDSSQLIDTPAAARLGPNRALFSEEGQERPEKLRPYGLYGLDWLKRVAERLAPTAIPESRDAAPPAETMTTEAKV